MNVKIHTASIPETSAFVTVFMMNRVFTDKEVNMSDSRRPSQRATYADLFERLWEATFLLDPESLEVLDSNLGCERATGLAADEIRGKTVTDWIPETEESQFQKSLRIARRRYYPFRFEGGWKGPESPLHMEMQACMLKLDGDEEVLQLICHDATQLREARLREEKYLAQLEALSTTDEMTRLANFRHFSKETEAEQDRSQRYETEYAVIFIDVDHFKNYNDTQGHPAGDEVLRQIGKILKKQSRTTDLPARYGGEEFAVLCRGVGASGAKIFAERIRKAIEDAPFANENEQPLGKVTVSVGVAGYPHDAKSKDLVIQAADEALYHSKHSGRNRVTSSEELKKLGKAS